MFTDTHCHINDERYENIDDVVAEFRAAGVDRVVCVGYDAASSFAARDISDRYEEVYFAAGIHPDGEREATKENLARIKELCRHEKCVAVGEIGLDYHYEPFDKAGQTRAFLRQLELAAEVSLPVSIHARDCTRDMLELLETNGALLRRGFVMHCFSGSPGKAEQFLKLGLYISFSGVLTFKNARQAVETAAAVPHEKALIETDSPYMAPEPLRGKRNQPDYVLYVAQKLGEIWNISPQEAARQTCLNAQTLFFGQQN